MSNPNSLTLDEVIENVVEEVMREMAKEGSQETALEVMPEDIEAVTPQNPGVR